MTLLLSRTHGWVAIGGAARAARAARAGRRRLAERVVDRLTGWSRVVSFSFPLGWADVTAARTAGRVVRPFLRGRGKFAGEFRGDDGCREDGQGWCRKRWEGEDLVMGV